MKINIIMIYYNNIEITLRSLKSIVKNSKSEYKLFLINNGSTENDDCILEYAKNFSNIEYSKNEKNEGCGIGRNTGLRKIEADCEYIILIDNDIYAPSDWDKRLISFMENNKRIGIAGPSTNFAGTPQMIPHLSLNSEEEMERFSEEIFQKKEKHSIVPKRWIVIGFCQIIRKEVLDQIGMFDENFKLYGCEDNDFCWRAQCAGWDLAYIKDCFVYHYGHGGLSMLGEEGTSQWEKNREYFLKKNKFI